MNCGKKVRLNPRNVANAASLPQISGYKRPGDFRPPVMQAAHERGHHSTNHDVMKMSDHEIGVGDMHVQAKRSQKQTR